MKIQQKIINIRTKKLGILLLDARLKARRNVEECAQIMGVQPEEYHKFEKGIISPSLPQIEAYAYFLDIPLGHFWGQQSIQVTSTLEYQQKLVQLQQIRNRLIATRLRLARDDFGISTASLSEKTRIDEEKIKQFELGKVPVPLADLEILGKALGIEIETLFDQKGIIAKWHTRKKEEKNFLELSDEFKEFVCKPVNKPYLDLAIRLSDMPAEKLRSIAESLLEITY
ncbi:MAG: helix-turn-helix domain-containing protein [Anaerolineaceae bacterium]|nr:helix-turn-helix domain-containing protein [Anaerolineaceae bacterium]